MPCTTVFKAIINRCSSSNATGIIEFVSFPICCFDNWMKPHRLICSLQLWCSSFDFSPFVIVMPSFCWNRSWLMNWVLVGSAAAATIHHLNASKDANSLNDRNHFPCFHLHSITFSIHISKLEVSHVIICHVAGVCLFRWAWPIFLYSRAMPVSETSKLWLIRNPHVICDLIMEISQSNSRQTSTDSKSRCQCWVQAASLKDLNFDNRAFEVFTYQLITSKALRCQNLLSR